MLRRLWQRLERSRSLSAAGNLEAWLASVEFVLETCSTAHQSIPGEAGIGQILDRVDRELMRFRNSAADLRPQLRRLAPDLAEPVRKATDDAFHLRNHTHAYLLRWQSSQLHLAAGSSPQPGTQREMEEGLLRTLEAARRLRADLAALAPRLREQIDTWSREG
jgi:hypothetical protein